jgi:hypothetical protein
VGVNLLPWLLVPIAFGVWLARRYRLVPIVMAVVLVGGFVVAERGSMTWADQARAFQAQLAAIPSARPLIVHASIDQYELAMTLPIWVDGPMMLAVAPCSGFLCDRLTRVSREGGQGYTPLAGPGTDVWL